MRKNLFTIVGCLVICLAAYRWSGVEITLAKTTALEGLYFEMKQVMFPSIYMYDTTSKELLTEDAKWLFVPTIVSYGTAAGMSVPNNMGQDAHSQQENTQKTEKPKDNNVVKEDVVLQQENHEKPEADANVPSTEAGTYPAYEKKVVINRTKLEDFDYLRQNFYQVDNTTTIKKELLNVEQLLSKNMVLKKDVEGPQILIYHTHSKEAFSDSKEGETVVALGTYLEQILESRYGIDVMHHTGQYDIPTRDNAYAQALPNVEKILKENPSIEVVIDLHRDGVAETTHLVTEINGKPTAQIMFFNGLCRTTSGELGSYPNPYLEDNLACSFQMHLTAAEYYPGFTRRIYLKGYRYNMHLCPKSMLIEVGAQTNTFQEAKNAMEPLADVLAKVLTGNF